MGDDHPYGQEHSSAAARRTATGGEERDRLWRLMTQVRPGYEDYQAPTDRLLPVVLDRAS